MQQWIVAKKNKDRAKLEYNHFNDLEPTPNDIELAWSKYSACEKRFKRQQSQSNSAVCDAAEAIDGEFADFMYV